MHPDTVYTCVFALTFFLFYFHCCARHSVGIPILFMSNQSAFNVLVANGQHLKYALQICNEMEASAKARGTGIAKRSPDYVAHKMLEGKAVIALHTDGTWAGFCYIETWGHGKYVANSGLIVSPELRKSGLAKQIKQKAFELSRTKYPAAKIFGLTTALAVMKINSDLGYRPVTYSELTDDEAFWQGCKSCVNYEILTMKGRTNCLCTAMLFDPEREKKQVITTLDYIDHSQELPLKSQQQHAQK